MDGRCAFCGFSNQNRICKTPEGEGKGPAFCSTLLYPEALEKANCAYEREDYKILAVAAAKNERGCYDCEAASGWLPRPVKCRIEETIDFCHGMGYKKIGLAFCGALHKEASVVARIFEKHGLEMVSVMCKVGGKDKTCLGLPEEEKLHPGRFEAMCNPLGQAEILNQAGTEFNVVLGLCVGHDTLFLSHSKSPCTVLAVKDRLLGHNPLAAVYTNHSYYGFLNEGETKTEEEIT